MCLSFKISERKIVELMEFDGLDGYCLHIKGTFPKDKVIKGGNLYALSFSKHKYRKVKFSSLLEKLNSLFRIFLFRQ
jgi:hypothetical protein